MFQASIRTRWGAVGVVAVLAFAAFADTPWAAVVLDFTMAPGQYAQVSEFTDPTRALGAPIGGGTATPSNEKLVSLGGFGGSIVLGFDHTVLDDPRNPRCLDAIVFGNAYWVGANPNRRWAECATIEISRDVNANGIADDPWYLIPGSHLVVPVERTIQSWDDDLDDPTYPPLPPSPGFPYPDWIPDGYSGIWTTAAFRLPPEVFDVTVLENPLGWEAEEEGIWGYADHSPTLILGDLDADNVVDDPAIDPEDFYTIPDDPFAVGITPGSGGGDAFDIAWAVDPATGEAANLEGFDFVRISTAANHVVSLFGELSAEIGAVADVGPWMFGDSDYDGQIALDDWLQLSDCYSGPGDPLAAPCPCRLFDYDDDLDLDLQDFASWQPAFAPTR